MCGLRLPSRIVMRTCMRTPSFNMPAASVASSSLISVPFLSKYCCARLFAIGEDVIVRLISSPLVLRCHTRTLATC
jgi:hypothetical protein